MFGAASLANVVKDGCPSLRMLLTRSHDTAGERPAAAIAATPSRDESTLDVSGRLVVGDSIETSQQFFQWFGTIEEQMEQEQESSFRQYNELLTKYSQLCADVLKEIENAKTALGVGLSTFFDAFADSHFPQHCRASRRCTNRHQVRPTLCITAASNSSASKVI